MEKEKTKQLEIEFRESEDTCLECGELWNSEYHMSDECVNPGDD